MNLFANHCTDAVTVRLEYVDLRPGQVVSGSPRVGMAELGQLGEHAIGVWEISPGICTDIESEEFFIVLFGQATVAFSDGRPPLRLHAGCVGHLAAGAETTWTVTETLRKVYLA
jgi:uncharacterized cupin superfamily protein